MGSELLFPILLVLLGGFMYLSIRKQKKRMAEVQEMQSSATTGARVQLTSGLYGTVIDTNSDSVDVEIAPGVVTRWNKLAIREVVLTEDAAATYPGALLDENDDEADEDTAVDGPSLIKDAPEDGSSDVPSLEKDTTDKPADEK
ncbi:protein-export membrane protein YajC [Gordonia effusa NBRC 100432]|uniref:Protein-export membrane protein YajC n=1 Tax=Gordonia effusa NBRC 100432 TaxID=1077974 RepID=H0QZL4_9ACTN|nr:preprotein translocase subunit YajC [Gordonia effusa]GAB18265.1 protein-export membrane protein YajC [Gordonia effusa NBRC 100432]